MKRVICTAIAVASFATAHLGLGASRADAWVWSSTVTLQGSSSCGLASSTWVWVEAPNGERGWATRGVGGYRFTFNRVPAGGMNVRVAYGSRLGNCTDYVYLRRPTVGSSNTVNVYKIIPNG